MTNSNALTNKVKKVKHFTENIINRQKKKVQEKHQVTLFCREGGGERVETTRTRDAPTETRLLRAGTESPGW